MVAMRDLTTPAMIYSIREMLERPECIAIFEKYPILLGFKPELEEAYKALVLRYHQTAIKGTRLAVWFLVALKRLGQSDEEILSDYPQISANQLAEAWAYKNKFPEEIATEIQENEEISY